MRARFAQTKPQRDRLLAFGFEVEDGVFSLTRPIMEGEFLLRVTVDEGGLLDVALRDGESDEDYTLYRTDAQGSYVGKVRRAILAFLDCVAHDCFVPSAFHRKQTERLLAYAQRRYGNAPQFLWKSAPQNAILRRTESGKWYAAILTVAGCKLGLPDKRPVEIVDLHATPARVAALRQTEGIHPGYHMNKNSWFTVVLDDSIDDARLFSLLDDSYALAGEKKTSKQSK